MRRTDGGLQVLDGLFPDRKVVAGGAGPAFVQSAAVLAFSGVTSNQTRQITGVTAGNALVVFGTFFRQGSQVAVPNITTSNTGTVVAARKPAGQPAFGSDGVFASIWVIESAGAGTHTIGFNPGGSITTWGVLYVVEFSGLLASGANDAANGDNKQSGSGTSVTTGPTGTLSQANNLIVCALCTEADTPGINTPSGYTDLYKSNGGTDMGSYFGYKIVNATAGVSASHSWTNSEEHQASLATLKAA